MQIFGRQIFDKDFVSKLYKKFLNLKNKKGNNMINKCAKYLSRFYSKESIQKANKNTERCLTSFAIQTF